ncbi:hypothetical protein NX059_004591 [Plenodomus lindquistii]|nr:hypothetical protein NX059_004591 [Plenodomus lindquistii]
MYTRKPNGRPTPTPTPTTPFLPSRASQKCTCTPTKYCTFSTDRRGGHTYKLYDCENRQEKFCPVSAWPWCPTGDLQRPEAPAVEHWDGNAQRIWYAFMRDHAGYRASMEPLPYTVDVQRPVEWDDDSDGEDGPQPAYKLSDPPQRYVLEVPLRRGEEPLSSPPEGAAGMHQTVRRLQEVPASDDAGVYSSSQPTSSQSVGFSSEPPDSSPPVGSLFEDEDRNFVLKRSKLNISELLVEEGSGGESDGEDESRGRRDEESDDETVGVLTPPRKTRKGNVFAVSKPVERSVEEPERELADEGRLKFF